MGPACASLSAYNRYYISIISHYTVVLEAHFYPQLLTVVALRCDLHRCLRRPSHPVQRALGGLADLARHVRNGRAACQHCQAAWTASAPPPGAAHSAIRSLKWRTPHWV